MSYFMRYLFPVLFVLLGCSALGNKPAVTTKAGYQQGSYVSSFAPAKEEFNKGEFSKAFKNHDGDSDFLGSVQSALLAFEASDYDAAIKNFDQANKKISERYDSSRIKEYSINSAVYLAERVSGNDELSDYEGEGFEHILMLNYNSIAYLMKGDRKAYNVNRKSIDWQNMLLQANRENIDKSKKEYQSAKQNLNSFGFDRSLETLFAEDKSQAAERLLASKMPSAYVNPFGFYLSGVINEIDSYEDLAARDAARISFDKALKLNPQSAVIQKARADLSKPAPAGLRPVNVVIADGTAPEIEVALQQVSIPRYNINYKVPKLVGYDSAVAKVVVSAGGTTVTASIISNVDAIVYRNEMDKKYSKLTKVALDIARAVGVKQANKSILDRGMDGFGKLVSYVQQTAAAGGHAGSLRDMPTAVEDKLLETSSPDTRSWTTLPAKIYGARLFVPRGVKNLTVTTYNKQGKVLASKQVALKEGIPNFIYARAIDSVLSAHAPEGSWVKVK